MPKFAKQKDDINKILYCILGKNLNLLHYFRINTLGLLVLTTIIKISANSHIKNI